MERYISQTKVHQKGPTTEKLAPLLAFALALNACVRPDAEKDTSRPDDTDTEIIDTEDTDVPELGLPFAPTPDTSGIRYQVRSLPGSWSAFLQPGDSTATGMMFAADLNVDGAIEIVAGNLKDAHGHHPVFHLEEGGLVQAGYLIDYFQAGASTDVFSLEEQTLGVTDLDQNGYPDLATGSRIFMGSSSGFSEPESYPSECTGTTALSKSVWASNLDRDSELELLLNPRLSDPLCQPTSAVYIADRDSEGVWTAITDRFKDDVGTPGAEGFLVDAYVIFMAKSEGATWLLNFGRTVSDRPSELIENHHRGIYRQIDGVFTVTAEDPIPSDAKFRETFNSDQFFVDLLNASGLSQEALLSMTPDEVSTLAASSGLNYNDYVSHNSDLGFSYAHPMGASFLDGRLAALTTSETMDIFAVKERELLDLTEDSNLLKIREGGDGTIGNPGWGHTPWGTVQLNHNAGDLLLVNMGWDQSNYASRMLDPNSMGPQRPVAYVDSGYVKDEATGTYFPKAHFSEAELEGRGSEFVMAHGVFPEDTPLSSGHSLCMNDLDHDGDPDLLAGTDFMPDGGLPYVLENVGTARWISVRLNVSNPDAEVHWTELDAEGGLSDQSMPLASYSSPATLCEPQAFIHVDDGATITNISVRDLNGSEVGFVEAPQTGMAYSL